MEKVKASMYSKESRKKVSVNGTEDQAEVLIMSDRPEKSYKNRGWFEKRSDCRGNIGRYRSKSRSKKI